MSEDYSVEEHERERDYGNQCQRHADHEHQHVSPDNGGNADQKILGTMVGHLRDLEEIVGDPAHDRTGLGPVEV